MYSRRYSLACASSYVNGIRCHLIAMTVNFRSVTNDHLLQRQTFEKKTCCANKFVSCKILPLLSTLPDKGTTTSCTTPLALDVNTEVLIYYYLCTFWRNWAGQFGNSGGFSPQSVCIVITVFLQ